MEGLPGCLPFGQLTLKSYLSNNKIYSSQSTGRDFSRALILPDYYFERFCAFPKKKIKFKLKSARLLQRTKEKLGKRAQFIALFAIS